MLQKIENFLEDRNFDEELIDGLSYICLGGSHMSGTNDDTSDYDYRGIIIPTDDYLLGLKRFEHSKLVSGQNGINDKNDIDIELYSVSKFIDELYYGEVVVHEMLHCDDNFILKNSDLLKPIFEFKEAFTSRILIYKYQSMIKGFVKRITLPITNFRRKDNIERVEQYGFETKCAMKSIQLLRLCVEYIQTNGHLNLKRKDNHYLLSIKKGEVPLNTIMKEIEDLEKELSSLLDNTSIPKRPNFDKINKFKKNYLRELYF